MSVIVEFSTADEEFQLGTILTNPPEMHVELERIVPTSSSLIPFLWVRGDSFSEFEQTVRKSDSVAKFTMLDQVDDWRLYRIEWAGAPDQLLEGIKTTQGTILEARGKDNWEFRLRFPNHDALSEFYNFCMEHDVAVHIDRSYTLTEKTKSGHHFGLSQEQREALLLALNEKYFETPSQTSLTALAEELGISEQAVSNRIRRGNKKVLEETLLS